MPGVCSAFGCHNRSDKVTGLTLHRFPLDDKSRLKEWLIRMKRDKFVPSIYSRLCSSHFTDDDYNFPYGKEDGKRLLKAGAVPSNFPQVESYFQTYKTKPAEDRPRSKNRQSLIDKRRKQERKQLCEELLQQCSDVGEQKCIPTPFTVRKPAHQNTSQNMVYCYMVENPISKPSILTRDAVPTIFAPKPVLRNHYKPSIPDAGSLTIQASAAPKPPSDGWIEFTVKLPPTDDAIIKIETQDELEANGPITPANEESYTAASAEESLEGRFVIMKKEEDGTGNADSFSPGTFVIKVEEADELKHEETSDVERDADDDGKKDVTQSLNGDEDHSEGSFEFGVDEDDENNGEELEKNLVTVACAHTDGCIKCDMCGSCFSFRGNLERHKRLHSGEKPHTCTVCGKSFAWKSYLSNHMARHETGSASSSYECNQCGKTFNDRSNRNRHVLSHQDYRPYQCKRCRKTFSCSQRLVEHIRVHTGDKPYECAICGNKYKVKRHLNDHMRLHTGVRPYHCDECDKTFTRKDHLNSHKQVHKIK